MRLMTPCVWRILCLRSSSSVLYPTFGNHRIYQLQHAETESAPNVVRLLSAETEVPICPHSAPKPKPKPKFGRSLVAVVHSLPLLSLTATNIALLGVVVVIRFLTP